MCKEPRTDIQGALGFGAGEGAPIRVLTTCLRVLVLARVRSGSLMKGAATLLRRGGGSLIAGATARTARARAARRVTIDERALVGSLPRPRRRTEGAVIVASTAINAVSKTDRTTSSVSASSSGASSGPKFAAPSAKEGGAPLTEGDLSTEQS